MNYRYLLLLAICFFVCLGCTPNNQGEQANKNAPKPNFLFLFADDQAFNTIQALGNEHVSTPNLDKLVRRGLTFTHCFNQGSWSGAVCVVSRAMLNSGRYIYHARKDINTVPLWGEYLGESGYTTFLTGKWHNGDATALKSFQQAKSIGKGMFETKGGVKGPGYYRPAPDKTTWAADDTTLEGHWSPIVKDIVQTDTGNIIGKAYTVYQHTSELYANNAIGFLEQQLSSEKPFFMYVAFNAPHDPRQSPNRFLEMYPQEKIPLPQAYLPEHPFDQGEKMTLRDEILAPFPRTEEVAKTHLQEYYAIISHMDQQIGRVLAALEASGKADNTYIIFSADHGLAVGNHGLMGKQNQYDHSVRMPLIICGPDIKAGTQNDALVYLQSMYATTCDLAGLPKPNHVEFQSLTPLIQGQTAKGETEIFGSYKDFQRMIRTKEMKLILYPKAGKVQLFNIEKDPWELENLAEKEAYQKDVQELFNRLIQLQKVVGDTLKLDYFTI